MGSSQDIPRGDGQGLKLGLSLLLLVVAGIVFAVHYSRQRGPNELAYFYDLSEQKLFTAALSAVPPIRGVNDSEEDGVRAVVIAPGGDASVKADRRIAYLEKYSPEFKRQVEEMRQDQSVADQPGRIGRSAAQAHTFVRRLTDTEWHALSSPQGEMILTEWYVAGPDGKYPAVCVP
jgi:hypothetical protein